MPEALPWPLTLTKTRAEMLALGLPDDSDADEDAPHATVISDRTTGQRRWVTVHELIFRLPGMPEHLAYRTHYDVGSTEYQPNEPWEAGDAVCTLVHATEKVVRTWEPVPAPLA